MTTGDRMPKRILVVNGSPKRTGNTARLVAWFSEGARLRGARVETVRAAEIASRSNGCTSCRACQKSGVFECVIRDGVHDVLKKMAGADTIVFATPLYFYGPSAQLKLIIDRMFSLYKWDNATDTFETPLRGKRMFLLLSAYEGIGLDVVERAFRLTAEYSGMPFASLLVPGARESGGIVAVKGVRRKAIDLGKKAAV